MVVVVIVMMAVVVTMRMAAAILVAMRVALDLDAAGHHEYAVPYAHDLDLGAVEPRKNRPGDDLVDRPQHRRAGAEIEHAVDRVDQGLSSCALNRIAILSSSRSRRAISTTLV